MPTCPKELKGAAKRRWNELVAILADTGLLTQADRDAMAAYCVIWARWRDAEDRLQNEPTVITSPEGGTYQNPTLHVSNKCFEQMCKLWSVLGLDPVSRTRLQVNPTKKSGVPSRDRSKGPPPPRTDVG